MLPYRRSLPFRHPYTTSRALIDAHFHLGIHIPLGHAALIDAHFHLGIHIPLGHAALIDAHFHLGIHTTRPCC